MTSQHKDLTSQHKDLTSQHNYLTSQHNYLTSDGRNMPPYLSKFNNNFSLLFIFYHRLFPFLHAFKHQWKWNINFWSHKFRDDWQSGSNTNSFCNTQRGISRMTSCIGYALGKKKWNTYVQFVKQRMLYFCLLVCLGFTVQLQMETSPFHLKGCKFWTMLGTHGHWAVRTLRRHCCFGLTASF